MIPIPADASSTAREAMELYDAGLADDEKLDWYRTLARLVNDEGPECGYCRQRGINQGRFAQPHLSGFAHLGCADDHQREMERDDVALDGPW